MLTLVAAPAVGQAVADYIRELEAEGIGLAEPLTVAAVLADLCRLAGVPVPPAVAAALVAEVTP